MKVVISKTGQIVEAKEDKTLLENLRESSVYVKSTCGGHATCRDCVIKVVTGEDQMTPPTFEEIRLLGNVFHITRERLACQTKLCGNVTIDTSMHNLESDQNQLRGKTSRMNPKRQNTIRRSPEEQAKRHEEKAVEHAKEQEGKTPLQGGYKRPKGLSYPKKR